MKAQSAIEYLVTYGWMLVAVSVVSGAIYSTVGGVCTESVSGFAGQNVQIEQFGSGDQLELVLANTDTMDVTIEKIEVKDSDTGEARTLNEEKDIEVGQTIVTSFEAVEDTKECNTLEVEIIYSAEGGIENQIASGTLTTSTELIDLDAPVPPSQLNLDY